MENLYDHFKLLTKTLTRRQKSYIHYNSFNNFFVNYEYIKSVPTRDDIYILIDSYIDILKSTNFQDLNGNFGISIVESHLFKIGKIFKQNLRFKEIIAPRLMFLAGGLIDFILIILKVDLYPNFPVPIITILNAIYFFFI